MRRASPVAAPVPPRARDVAAAAAAAAAAAGTMSARERRLLVWTAFVIALAAVLLALAIFAHLDTGDAGDAALFLFFGACFAQFDLGRPTRLAFAANATAWLAGYAVDRTSVPAVLALEGAKAAAVIVLLALAVPAFLRRAREHEARTRG